MKEGCNMNKSMLKKAAIFGLAGVMAVAAGCGSNKDAGNANSNEALEAGGERLSVRPAGRWNPCADKVFPRVDSRKFCLTLQMNF